MHDARRLLPFALATLVACGHAPPLTRAKLEVVQTPNGGIRPFVRATVAGEPMVLLVDTGAVQSTLPAWFARAHELPMRRHTADVLMTDANGTLTAMRRLPGVPVQFDGETTGGTIEFLMSPPGPLRYGVLAPQDLLRRGAALVIDLEREELRYEPEPAALERVRGTGATVREVEFDRCLDEGFFERAHRFVEVTVNGVPAKMLIDTGAERTALARNHPALGSMSKTTGDRGAAAGVSSLGKALLVDDVPITFAGTPFVVPAMVLPASSRCGHGALGADLLRRCTLVWGWSKLWAACRAGGPAR